MTNNVEIGKNSILRTARDGRTDGSAGFFLPLRSTDRDHRQKISFRVNEIFSPSSRILLRPPPCRHQFAVTVEYVSNFSKVVKRSSVF